MTKSYRAQVYERGSTTVVDFTLSLSHLRAIPAIGGQQVQLLQGRVVSNPYVLHVLDTADVITSRLGSDSRPALLGRLIRFQQQIDGGAWATLDTGRISHVGEPEGPGLYAIDVSDENWVARRHQIFEKTTTVQLHPFGPVDEWGPLHRRRRAGGYDSRWQVAQVNGDAVQLNTPDASLNLPLELAEALEYDLLPAAELDTSATNADGNFTTLRFHATEKAGSPVDQTAKVIMLSSETFGDALSLGRKALGSMWPGNDALQVRNIWVHWPGHGLSPGNLVTARLHFIAPGIPVSEEVPHYEGGTAGIHLGQLIADILEGEHGGEPVRLSASSKAALIAADLPNVYLRETEAADRSQWLERNVYAHWLHLPLVDREDGLRIQSFVTPKGVDPATLPMLAASNVADGTWENSGRDAVTKLVVTFRAVASSRSIAAGEREKVARVDGFRAIEVTHEVAHDNLADVGSMEQVFRTNVIIEPGNEVLHTAWLGSQLFPLLGDGPLYRTLEAEAITLDLSPGDLIRVDAASLKLPNPVDQARTGTRIARVLEVSRSPASQRVRLLDFGPSLQPLAAPTVAIAQNANPDLVDVTISGLGTDQRAVIEVTHAATDTQPDDDAWTIRDGGKGNGTHSYLLARSGGFGHARAHATLPGRIPSAWVYDSVALSVRPIIQSVATSLSDAGAVELDVEAVDTAGIRVHFAIHTPDEDPGSLDDSEDFAYPLDGEELTGVTVPPGQAITLEHVPYPTFSGGSVSGTPGAGVRETLVRGVVDALPPTVRLTESGAARSLTATFTLEAEAGAAGATPLLWRYHVTPAPGRAAIPFDEPAAFDSVTDGVHSQTILVPRALASSRTLFVIVSDTNDRETQVSAVVAPLMRRPMPGVSTTFNSTNETVVAVAGNEGDDRHYITVGEDTDPADPTAGAHDAEIAAESGSINTGVVVSQGAVAHVKVVTETTDGETWDPRTWYAKNVEGGVITASISFNADDEVIVTANGPAGTTHLYVTAAEDTDPADPTTSDAEIVGRSGTVNTGATVAAGNTAFVKIRAFDGSLGEVVAFSRTNDAAQAAPVAYVRITALSDISATVEYDGSDGSEGRSIATEYRRRIDTVDRNGTVTTGTLSAWSGTLPDTEAIARVLGITKIVNVWVRDVDLRQSAAATVQIEPAPETVLSLNDFSEQDKEESVRWDWVAGAFVHEVMVFWDEYAVGSVPADPWPNRQPNRVPNLILPAATTHLERPKPDVGRVTYLQFQPVDSTFPPRSGTIQRAIMLGLPESVPRIQFIGQAPATNPAPNRTDVVAVVSDRQNRPGRVHAWVNRASETEADPTGAPDAHIDVTLSGGVRSLTQADVWTLTGGGTANLFRDLLIHAQYGKRVWLRFDLDDGPSSGQEDGYLRTWHSILEAASGVLIPDIVTTAAIVDEAVATAKLAAGAATEAKIAAGAVTETKIADDAVSTPKLVAGSVIAAKIATGAVEAEKIAADAVVAVKIAAGAVTTEKLDALAVTADKIAANAVTAAKLNVAELSEIATDMGVIVKGTLRNGGNTAGIRIDAADALPGSWVNYLDLGATGAGAVLKTPHVTLRANGALALGSHVTMDTSGNVVFSGALAAATGSFAGSLSAATGTFAGDLSAAGGTFEGDLSAAGGTFAGDIVVTQPGIAKIATMHATVEPSGPGELAKLTIECGAATFTLEDNDVLSDPRRATFSDPVFAPRFFGKLIGDVEADSFLFWDGFAFHDVEAGPNGSGGTGKRALVIDDAPL